MRVKDPEAHPSVCTEIMALRDEREAATSLREYAELTRLLDEAYARAGSAALNAGESVYTASPPGVAS